MEKVEIVVPESMKSDFQSTIDSGNEKIVYFEFARDRRIKVTNL